MDVFEQYINFSMFVLSLLVWVAVLIQRRIFEAIFSYFKINIKTAKLWRSVLLPLGGPGTGIVFAVLFPITFPAMYVGVMGKVFAGIICGLASAKVYQIFKQVLSNKLTQLTQKVETTKTTVEKTETNTTTQSEDEIETKSETS